MAGSNKDQKGIRYRPAQARPSTLEQLRQYVWQELQQIGGALNNSDDKIGSNCLPLCDDLYGGGGGAGPITWVPPDAPIQGEILWAETELVYDDEGQFDLGMFYYLDEGIFLRRGWGGACKYSPNYGVTWEDRTLPPSILSPDATDPQRRFLQPMGWQMVEGTLYANMGEYTQNTAREKWMATVAPDFSDWNVGTFEEAPLEGIYNSKYGRVSHINEAGQLVYGGRNGSNSAGLCRYPGPFGGWEAVNVLSESTTFGSKNINSMAVLQGGYMVPVSGYGSGGAYYYVQYISLNVEGLISTTTSNNWSSANSWRVSGNGESAVVCSDIGGSSGIAVWTPEVLGNIPVYPVPGLTAGIKRVQFKAGHYWVMLGCSNGDTLETFYCTDISGATAGQTWVQGPDLLLPEPATGSGSFNPYGLYPMKGNDWCVMYREQISGKLIYVKFDFGTFIGDDVEPTDAIKDGDILEWVEAEGHWCKSYRTRFIADGYVPGREYRYGDEVSNGSQISEAITQPATENPFVAPTGDAFNVYAGTMATNSTTGKSVTFGNRYTLTQGIYVAGYRIYTEAGQTYGVYSIKNPTSIAPITQLLQSFTAASTGWRDIGISPTAGAAGSVVDLLVVTTEETPIQVDDVLSYSYVTPPNSAPATAGQIVHADKSPGTLSISHIDDFGADQSAVITALSAGDTITRNNVVWSITSASTLGSVTDFIVTPAIQDSPDGVQDVTFSRITAAPIVYAEDPGYWGVTQEPGVNAQGLFGVDVGLSEVPVIADNAYGTDIQLQLAYVPTQWKVKVIAGI